jgi:hypothetical protein
MKGLEVGDRRLPKRPQNYRRSQEVSDPVVIVNSGRHKAQRIVLTENALAIIDRKGRWYGQP